MDGISRLAGVGPSLLLGGERIVVRALRVKDFALIEAEVLKQLVHPLTAVRRAWQIHGDAKLLKVCCEEAASVSMQSVNMTLDQYREWRHGPSGRMTVLWCSLDRPPWKWFTESAEAEIRRDFRWMLGAEQAIAQANGTDERGVLESMFDTRESTGGTFPWEIVYRRLHDNGLSAEQIGETTLRQVNVFLCDEKRLNPGETESPSTKAGKKYLKAKRDSEAAQIAANLFKELSE